MRTSLAERLLSLFTTTDRASAIIGDLTEEQGDRGPIGFWLEVLRVFFALWRRVVTDAPLRVLLLALSGCALLVGPGLVGVAAVALFPAYVHSPVSWIALAFCWLAGALWTGASLVGMAPSRGMAASVTLALVGGMLLVLFLVRVPRPDLPTIPLVIVYTTVLVVPALLLAGAAIARCRMILRGVPT